MNRFAIQRPFAESGISLTDGTNADRDTGTDLPVILASVTVCSLSGRLCFLFARFLYSTIRICRMIGMGEKQVLPDGSKLVVTDETVCPFS